MYDKLTARLNEKSIIDKLKNICLILLTLFPDHCKLINLDKLLTNKEKTLVPEIIENYLKKIDNLYAKNQIEKFSFDNDNLWPIIKKIITDI